MHTSTYGGKKRARIEIIPLIDIMFFLLASFMLVSLNLASAKSIKVDLPIAQSGDPENKPNTLSISIDVTGGVFLDKNPVGRNELQAELRRRHALEPNLRVVISGDTDVRHGVIVSVLDRVRAAGIQTVAFSTRLDDQH
jgi:biopolymer transport protein ExbD